MLNFVSFLVKPKQDFGVSNPTRHEQKSRMKTSLKNHLARCLAVSCLLTISTTYAQTPYILGGLETTSMTRIVPDKILFPTGLPAINNPLGNWEPYTSVLGASTFLIVANTYAEGTTDKQRYRVAFQPAAGGPTQRGRSFLPTTARPLRLKSIGHVRMAIPAAWRATPGSALPISWLEARLHQMLTSPALIHSVRTVAGISGWCARLMRVL